MVLLFFARTSIVVLLVSVATSLAHAARPSCDTQFVSIAEVASPSRFESFYVEVKTETSDHRVVFFDQLKAKRGKPTLVLLNGLFVPREDLRAFRETFEAQSKGEGLLIMHYSTQMESLAMRHHLSGDAAKNVREDMASVDFGREVAEVLKVADLRGPIVLVGYSYGGLPLARFLELYRNGEAKLPGGRNQIRESIFLSTLVEAVDEIPMGSVVLAGRNAVESMMMLNPWMGGLESVKRLRGHSARSSAVGIVDGNLMGGFKLPDGVDRSAMILGLTAQIGAAADFSLRTEGKAAQPNTGAVHFFIAGGESAGRMVAQKAAAEAWGVTPEIVPDVPHHALAHKPEVLVPILLKRLR